MGKANWLAIGVLGVGIVSLGQATLPAKVPFAVSKGTTVLTGPLLADGRVDYVEALNDRYGMGVLPENNAFVALLGIVGTSERVVPPRVQEAMLAMAGAKESAGGMKEFTETDYYKGLSDAGRKEAYAAFSGAQKEVWRKAEHPEIAAYLEGEGKYLDAFVAASKLRRWWIPAVSPDGSWLESTTSSGFAAVRVMDGVRGLCARATLRAGEGDMAGFVEDALAVKRWGALVGQGATLFERLVGVLADQCADQAIGAVAGAGLLREADCASLLAGMRGLPALPDMREAVDVAERWRLLDGVAMLSVTKVGVEEEDGFEINSFAGLDQSAVDWDGMLRRANGLMDRSIAGMGKGTWKELRDAEAEQERESGGQGVLPLDERLGRKAGETRAAYTERVWGAFLSVFGGAIVRSEEVRRRGVMVDAMTGALLSLAYVKARTGKWPGTEGELVRSGVELPGDFYGEGAVKYRVSGKGAGVYSVWMNGKDEGGMGDDFWIGVKQGGK